jgi:hypothetical protein
MGLNSWLTRISARMAASWLMSNTAVQQLGGICGGVSGVMFILAFIVADFIPPTNPEWDAETLATFYRDHITRIRAGAGLLMISGGFYLPFSAAISYQIRRIPRLPYMIHQLQLAAAAAGIWTFMLPGIVLAITSYRPERPAEITLALNDFFVGPILLITHHPLAHMLLTAMRPLVDRRPDAVANLYGAKLCVCLRHHSRQPHAPALP